MNLIEFNSLERSTEESDIFIENDTQSYIDNICDDQLNDSIQYYCTGELLNWFNNLDYCDFEYHLETSHGYYTTREPGEKYEGKGVYMASLPLSEEIEIQLDDDSLEYLYTGPRYIEIYVKEDEQ